MAGRIEFFQAIARRGPSKAIIRIAGQTLVRLHDGEAQRRHHAHVRNAVKDEQALHELGKGSRAKVGPADARTVQRTEHKVVAKAYLTHNFRDRGRIDFDREGGTFVCAI